MESRENSVEPSEELDGEADRVGSKVLEIPSEAAVDASASPMEGASSGETSAEALVDTVVLDAASLPFEGRWSKLISTTNWEKGQIIHEWREALKATSAPATEYSDEAWARRVGGVTGQHIGRLRRVYERFGSTFEQYQGLYWSHFQAAIDWEDAEMWLEGCIQNGWSVSNMRKARWEALGAPAELKPQDTEIISSELDEDLDVREDREPPPASSVANVEIPPDFEGPDFGDETSDELTPGQSGSTPEDEGAQIYAEGQEPAPFVRPFENIPDLPEDVSGAFESFKLAILRHKLDEWREISREDMLSALESLKELALSPAATDSSF